MLGTVFSKDSTYLVSVSRDRSMKLTEVATQRFIDNITSITPGALKGGLLAVARNPVKRDQKVKVDAGGIDKSDKWYDELLIGGSDGVPRLYKMHRDDQARHRRRRQQGPRVRGDAGPDLRAAPSARTAASSSPAAASTARARSASTRRPTASWCRSSRASRGRCSRVAFAPDGKTVASAGFDGMVRLSDPATGKLIKEFMPVPLKAAATQAKTP